MHEAAPGLATPTLGCPRQWPPSELTQEISSGNEIRHRVCNCTPYLCNTFLFLHLMSRQTPETTAYTALHNPFPATSRQRDAADVASAFLAATRPSSRVHCRVH